MVRHYLNEPAAQELWMRSENAPLNHERPCPSCLKPMRLVSEPSWIGNFEIDVCRRCYMMWFDQGEHYEIPHPHIDLDSDVQEIERKVARIEVKVDQEREKMAKDDLFGDGPDEFWKQVLAVLALPVEMESPVEPRFPILTAFFAVTMLFVGYFAGFGSDMIAKFAYYPASPFQDGGTRMLTSVFAHGGWVHLLVNVYFFGMFGDDVEEDLGHFKFALFLLITMVATGLLQFLFSLHGELPHVGASGVVFALMTYYAFRFPKVRMAYLVPVVHTFHFAKGGIAWLRGARWLRIPVWTVFLGYLAFNVICYYALERGGLTRVSHLGHLLGAVVGAILFRVWRPEVLGKDLKP
jgi:membrane associated rhomboid family serine protease